MRVDRGVGVLFTARPGVVPGQETQQLLLKGDMVLWTVAVKPDKTVAFEQVLAGLRTAPQESERPERSPANASYGLRSTV